MIRHVISACVMSACIYSVGAFAAVNDSSIKIHWGYKGNDGPERWGQLDPGFAICATGKDQSPINITHKVEPAPFSLQIHYQSAPMVMMEDGPTTLELRGSQTMINDGHTLQLNFPAKGVKERISYKGKTYHLIQFHFHSPSETLWHNQSFPLEIHFVHQSDDGEVLALGVFAKGGKSNKAIQKIVTNVPAKHGVEQTIAGQSINPNDLLPVNHNYYSYSGSLTTPPCIEGLQWIVMSDPITVTPAQLLTLRQAANGGNARPVQPLFGRKVYFSEEK